MKARNFGGIDQQNSGFESAKVVIIPVPFESGSDWFKGADKGPEALIEASSVINLYDIQLDFDIRKAGIHTAEVVRERKSPEKMIREVETRVSQVLRKKKFPVIIGGDHSAGFGSMKACAEYYREKDFCILQLGAHANQRQTYHDSMFHQNCIMARASGIAPVLQAGIRSMSHEERDNIRPDRVFFAHNILDSANKTWMYDFLNKLEKHVYISVDLDVLDPSVMPAVASPEPGGLSWYQVLDILKAVNDKSVVVGFDVTGLCPIKYNRAPNLLAARLLTQMLTYRFAGSVK